MLFAPVNWRGERARERGDHRITVCLNRIRPTKFLTATSMAEPKPEPAVTPEEEKDVKAPNIIERVKEEIEAIVHTDNSPHHHKETHGRSDDIDENTPVDKVKGPSVFERVKEEIEALVGAVLPKKEFNDHESSSK